MTTFREKVEYLVAQDAGRGAGEKLLLQRTKEAFEKNPEFVPAYNTKVLVDAVLASYEKRKAKRTG